MGYREGDKTFEFEGKIEHTTAKAYLVEPTLGPKQIWVPKSQLRYDPPNGPDGEGNFTFEVTEWWLDRNPEMKDFVG